METNLICDYDLPLTCDLPICPLTALLFSEKLFGQLNQLEAIILALKTQTENLDIVLKSNFDQETLKRVLNAIVRFTNGVVNQAGVKISGTYIYIGTLEIDLAQLLQQFSDVSSVGVPSGISGGGVGGGGPVAGDIQASGTSDQSVGGSDGSDFGPGFSDFIAVDITQKNTEKPVQNTTQVAAISITNANSTNEKGNDPKSNNIAIDTGNTNDMDNQSADSLHLEDQQMSSNSASDTMMPVMIAGGLMAIMV
ncbi:hypothetical protein HDV02_003043 [Globomyces sp. JEL0801]|nr:hypothetical protein HDV02_003043 [Globomyces sp. JEL0801]